MEILFEDEHLIAVNKVPGMMVYPSPIGKNCHLFATKELKKMGYSGLHTVHRLDRPTSGVLLFAKHKDMAADLSDMFREHEVKKTYNALLRGYIPEKGIIDKALKKEGDGEEQQARTDFRLLEKIEKEVEISKYPSSRFSWVEARPLSGRMHQIRRHFSHLRHPIIGDRPYGDRHYNKYFKEELKFEGLFLHAKSLEFEHPDSGEGLIIKAELPPHMKSALEWLGISAY